jgi:hypothetical protein
VSTCAKPGCSGSATTVLSYRYEGAVAILEDPPEGAISPHVYALCGSCAEKLQPPRGWTLEDHRSRPPLFLTDSDHYSPPALTDEREEEGEQVASGARQLFFGQSA